MKINSTKAAILVELNHPLEIDDVEFPSELDFGQILVQINYSGICGSQLGEIAGAKGPDGYLPHLLGHEGSGIVIETGPNVSTVEEGDHVVLHWRPSKGIEAKPPVYKWKGKTLNAGYITTFNEYAIVSENRVTKIPASFDKKKATLFGCAVPTAFGVVNNNAKIKVGQSGIIFGIGGVGLNIVQAAEMVSANPIIGVDLVKQKLEMGREFGLTHGFIGGEDALNENILNIVGSKGADVVIDTTGNSRVIEQAYKLTHPDGKTILVGVPKKGDNISIYSLPLHFKKVLTGSHGGDAVPDLEIPRFIRLIDSGKMTLNGFITHEFNLEKINDALDLIRNGQCGRVILKMC